VPEVAVWLDGSMPFRAETTKGYVTGLATKYARDLIAQGAPSSSAESPVRFETRFHYNESFESIYAMVPSGIMLMLIMFPAIMSTIGVVREKETGSVDFVGFRCARPLPEPGRFARAGRGRRGPRGPRAKTPPAGISTRH
jgi:hypothetical protein